MRISSRGCAQPVAEALPIPAGQVWQGSGLQMNWFKLPTPSAEAVQRGQLANSGVGFAKPRLQMEQEV